MSQLSPQEVKAKVQEIQAKAIEDSQTIGIQNSKYFEYSPALISDLVIIIRKIQESIGLIFALPISSQEEYAWLVVNGCKLIYELGQPLIWIKCGKLIVNSFIYASISMESIINLTTTVHLQLRFKMYASAYYCLMADSLYSDANSLLAHVTIQLKELRLREEIDLPIPEKILSAIVKCEMDLAVMRGCLAFFLNADVFTLSNSTEDACKAPKYSSSEISTELINKLNQKSFIERVISECCNVLFMNSLRDESWGKKASLVIELFWKKISDKSYVGGFTVDCLLDIASLIAFENITLSVNKSTILNAIWSSTSSQSNESNQYNRSSYATSLDILRLIWPMIKEQNGYKNDSNWLHPEDLQSFLNKLNELLSMETLMMSRKRFIMKVAITIWSKNLYAVLQYYLSISSPSSSNKASDSGTVLRKVEPYLDQIINCLGFIIFDDGVLYASLSTLCGIIMKQNGNYRGAISLMQRSLQIIDDLRAHRVDMSLYNTTHVNDMKAILKSSLSISRDENDKVDSLSRPGALALPGKGLFGAGGLADRSDIALAEIHSDLIALYFRTELEYVGRQKQKRLDYIALNNKKLDSTTSENVPVNSNLQTKKTSTLKSKFQTKKEESTTALANNIGIPNLNDDLGGVTRTLKAYCCKNNYMRAILNIELARVEIQNRPERAFNLLKSAKDLISNVAIKEEKLKNELLKQFDMSISSKCPVILSRSHRFVYVSPYLPNITEYFDPDSVYFRILAKEYGSGTIITSTSAASDYKGCDTKILPDWDKLLAAQSEFISHSVKISSLKANELYVFGSIAYDNNNKPLEFTLSSTSIAIEALNPLPIYALWSLLASTAFDILADKPLHVLMPESVDASLTPSSLIQFCSKQVVNRYFIKSSSLLEPNEVVKGIESDIEFNPTECFAQGTKIVETVIGNGVNILIGLDPVIDSIAVDNSSCYALIQFVVNYLIYIETIIPTLPSDRAKLTLPLWGDRASDQWIVLYHLRQLSAVLTIASYTKNQEICLKCVFKGSYLLSLLQHEETSIAHYTQHIIIKFIVALQSLKKKYWNNRDHDVYCKLFGFLIRGSIVCKNLSSLGQLLNSFYKGISDATEEAADYSIQLKYYSVFAAIDQLPLRDSLKLLSTTYFNSTEKIFLSKENPIATNDAKTKKNAAPQAAETAGQSIGYLWGLAFPNRQYFLRSSTAAILTLLNSEASSPPEALQFDKYLRELPRNMSELLMATNFILKQITRIENQSNETSSYLKVARLLKILPLHKNYLANSLQESVDSWQLSFIKDTEIVNAAVTSDASATKGGKSQKNQINTQKPQSVPERFLTTTDNETRLQTKSMAETVALIAHICYPFSSIRTAHPKNISSGPFEPIDYTSINTDSLVEEKSNSIIEPSTESKQPNNSKANYDNGLSAADYIKHLFASFDLFVTSKCISSATVIATRIWSFIIDKWYSPIEFTKCNRDPIHVQVFTKRLVSLIQQITEKIGQDGINIDDDNIDGKEEFTTLSDNLHPRSFKQHLLTLRDISWYFLACLFHCGYYEDIVENGRSILESFVSVSIVDGVDSLYNQCKYFADYSIPLMLFTQSKIIVSTYRKILEIRQDKLSSYVQNYEIEQSKKRKKKQRIMRLEKDEDELRFEEGKQNLTNIVIESEKSLKTSEQYLEMIQTLEKNYQNYFAVGYQLYDKTKKNALDFVAECELHVKFDSTILESSNQGSYLEDCLEAKPDMFEKFEKMNDQFRKLIDYLRERKLTSVLLESINFYGDILLQFVPSRPTNRRMSSVFGNSSRRCLRLREIWHDAIDGVFNCLDSCEDENWDKICKVFESMFVAESKSTYTGNKISKAFKVQGVGESDLSQQLPCMFTVFIVLGKLIQFASANDYDRKLKYALIASKICQFMFKHDSIAHPVALYGFAAYVLQQDIGSYISTTLRREYISSQGLCLAANSILEVLQNQGKSLEMLPVCVLMEYFHGVSTRDPSKWLHIRTSRIRSLISLHFFSEAASMIAGVQPSIVSIRSHSFANPSLISRGKSTQSLNSAINVVDINSNNVSCVDLAKNGLDFYGLAPFYNNLPPNSPENEKCLAWIKTYIVNFKAFAMKITEKRMSNKLSDDEKAVIQQWQSLNDSETNRAPVERLKSVSAMPVSPKDKKSQQAKSRQMNDVSEDSVVSFPILHPSGHGLIAIVCSEFLAALSNIGQSYSPPNQNFENLIAASKSTLDSSIENTPLSLQSITGALTLLASGSDDITNDSTTKIKTCLRMIQDPKYAIIFWHTQLQIVEFNFRKQNLKEGRRICALNLTFMVSIEKIYQIFSNELGFSSLSNASKEVYFNYWIQFKHKLAILAKEQGRLEESLAIVNQLCSKELASNLYGFWIRKLLLLRSEIYLDMNKIQEAERDGIYVFDHYRSVQPWRIESEAYKATLLCAKLSEIRHRETPKEEIIDLNYRILDVLLFGRYSAMRLASDHGYRGHYTGAINNSSDTLSKENSSLATTHKIIPWHHFLLPSKKSLEGEDINALLSPLNFCEFTNRYLPEVDAIVKISSAVGLLIDDITSSNYFDYKSTYTKQVIQRESEQIINEDNEQFFNRDDMLRLQRFITIDGLQSARFTFFSSSESLARLVLCYGKVAIYENSQNLAIFGEDIVKPFDTAYAMIAKSNHDWKSLRQICIQLMDVYGSSIIKWKNSTTTNETTLLKATVRILQRALKLTRIVKIFEALSVNVEISSRADIVKSMLALSDEEKQSLEAKLPSEAAQLIKQYYHTSKNQPTVPSSGQDTAYPEASDLVRPPSKGKPNSSEKSNGRKLLSPKGAAPTFAVDDGRAISVLEGITLLAYLVSNQDLAIDRSNVLLVRNLHAVLKKASPLYESKFCFDSLPTEATDEGLVVSLSSMSLLWSPVPSPLSFKGGSLARVLGYNNIIGSSYQHMAVYILLGASQAIIPIVAPVVKGKPVKAPLQKSNSTVKQAVTTGQSKAAPLLSPVVAIPEDPILTKLVIYLPDVMIVEHKLKALHDLYKSQTVSITDIAREFGDILILLIEILSCGYIDASIDSNKKVSDMTTQDIVKSLSTRRASTAVSQGSDDSDISYVLGASALAIRVSIKQSEYSVSSNEELAKSRECILPFNETTILSALSVVNWQSDTNNMIDNYFCILIRSVLGFGSADIPKPTFN